MQTIAFLNQKGGVGKTSSVHHLAGTLAAMGRRVLLIDCDPQASLSQGFFGPAAVRDADPTGTVAEIFAGNRPFPDQVIRPTPAAGVSIVMGSRAATVFNVPEPELSPYPHQVALRTFLEGVEDGAFDLCLIDCHPDLQFCSWAALAAADHLVVPLQAEDYGAQGLEPVQESVAEVQRSVNPGLEILGYLVTMFNKRLGIHAAYDSHLRRLYGEGVFASQFPLATDFKEAVANRLPISGYKPRSAAAKAVKAIADELLARIEARALATIPEAV